MKFSLVLAPIASMAVLAHGDKPAAPPSGSEPVSFTHEGVKDVLDVATNNPKADGERAIQGVKTFFKRNPAVLKSILSVANDPKHKKAKDEIANQAIALYSSSKGKLNLYDVGLKAVNYVYKNPEALDLIQQAGIKAMKDSPTLVDDFFASFEKLTEKDPSIVRNLKDYVIDFSHDQEDAYKQIFEMGLKSALINPGFASHLAVHALLVDKISCAGSKSDSCSCKDEYKVEEPAVPDEPEVDVEEPEIESPGEPEEPETPSYVTEKPNITPETVEVPEVEVEEPEIIEEVDVPEQPVEPEVETEEPEIEEPEVPEGPEVEEPIVPEVEEPEVPEEPEVEELEIPEEPEVEEPEVPEYNVAPPKPEQYETTPPVQPEPIVESPPVPVDTYNVAPPAPKPKNTYAVTAPPPSKPVY